MRKKVIAGNWKMNKTISEATNYISEIKDLVKESTDEIIICAPYTDLALLVEQTKNTNIKIGAQNMHYKENGAYTGEVTGAMLKEIGVEYVIIGHSERRAYYNETDESVNLKIIKAFEDGLKPILCVGESLEQRESGITRMWITNQVKLALKDVAAKNIENLIIAYEPIWAIGTGRTASSFDANESISWIRKEIKELYGENIANKIIIQYGGSVKSSNAKELFDMEDIDGGLVGGASLDPVEFSKIVNWNK